MGTAVSVTEEVIDEIGEQVSQILTSKFSKSKGLDLSTGIGMYENHLRTSENLTGIQYNKKEGKKNETKNKSKEQVLAAQAGIPVGYGKKNKSKSQVLGKSFEEKDAHERRRQGKEVYRTDELAELLKNTPDHPLFKKYPKLKKLAKANHEQTDLVEIRSNRAIVTYQHKKYKNVSDGITAFLEDSENDHFAVPKEQYDEYHEKLEKKIKKLEKRGKDGSDIENLKKLKKIKKGLQESSVTSKQVESPRKTLLSQAAGDASKRIADNITVGVASDIAVFAFGGAVYEIRAAYRSPDEFTVTERCSRLLRAIWKRLQALLKDRSLRELGSEAVLAIVSIFARPLKIAQRAIEKIVGVLRRLWNDFVSGRIRTVADVVAAALKAVYMLASVAVALSVENALAVYLQPIPGGDVVAALIAAVVAAVMIVVGNRSITAIVESVAAMFSAGARARARRKEIERICEEAIPQLVADRERLVDLMDLHFADRESFISSTLEGLRSSRDGQDIGGFIEGLGKLNEKYECALPWRTFEEIDQFMLDDSQPLRL